MSEMYPGTNVPFEDFVLSDLHDPIMLGLGSGSVQATSQVYGSLAETFDKAVGDLRAVLKKSQHAQQGQAAGAARQHVLKVVSAGEVGAEHARLATYALQEQAAYYSRARTDMKAAADTAATPTAALSLGTRGAAPNPMTQKVADQGHTIAVEGAHLYQNNSNHNLSYIFQGFEAPQIAAPDVSAGAQPQAPGWGGGGLGAGAHAVTPAGSGGSAGSPVGPLSAGAGAGSGPAGGPGSVAGPSDPPPVPGAPSLRAGPAGPAGGRTGPGVGSSPAGDTSLPGGRVPPSSSPPSATLPSTASPAVLPSTRLPSVPVSTPSTTSLTPQQAPGSSAGTGASPRLSPPSLSGSKLDDPDLGRSGWVPGQPWTSRPGAPGPGLPGTGSPASGPGGPGTGSGAFRSGDPFGRSSGGVGAEPWSNTGGETRSGRPSASSPGEGSAGSPRTSTGGQPLMPMGGAAGRGQDAVHRRPAWLVEDDPEGLWMSGLPPHGPAVIEPLED